MKAQCILSAILAALIFCSCSEGAKLAPNVKSLQEDGYSIPIEEALSSLETFMQDVGMISPTKGSVNEYVDSYFTVSGPSTKAAELSGDVLYAINFKDEGGYALLSADRRIKEEILAVTESGSVSEEDFDETDWFKILSDNKDISEEEFMELVESGVLNLTANNINATCFKYASGQMKADNLDDGGKQIIGTPYYSDLDSVDEDGASGTNVTKYGPYIETKWGQDGPFNLFMEGHKVGCVPVAAAQIVYYHRNALDIEPVFDGHQCDWETIGSVYNYATLNKGTEEAQEQIGHFMLDVKNSCGMKVSKTSGTFRNAEDCLSHYGFKDIYHDFAHIGGSRHDQNHLDDVVESLKDKKPVIMLAFCIADWPWNWCGHAYVIDGYRKDYNGEFLHINWGWTGAQDGYFARGCFDERQRDSIEEGFDNNKDTDEKPSNFNITHYYVHYEI